MLPNKPAKDYCEANVGIENVVLYYGKMACKKCRYYLVEVSKMADGVRVFAHARAIPPKARVSHLELLLEDTAYPLQTLTTRSDFIELRVSNVAYDVAGETLDKEYFTFIFRHKNLVSVAIDENKETWISYNKETLAIHPDSVQDLLNFIKEG